MPYEVLESGGRYEVLGDAPASVQAGASINSIPRQLGLTARYGLEGLANTAQILTEPIRNALAGLSSAVPTDGSSPLMMSRKAPPVIRPLGEAISSILDATGLPSPQGANERVIGDATRLVAGSGGLAKVAQLAGGAASPLLQFAGKGKDAAVGAAKNAWQFLSDNLPQQLSSAAGAGLFGGASREAGGNPLVQTGAALVGGVAGGMVPGSVNSVVNTARSMLPNPSPQQLDAQISVLLQRANVDYSQLPAGVRNSLRGDLADALNTGREIDPQAVRRLADFRLTGTTPTRGMVSQNPVQITREMNLAKIGANSADERLQGLPMIQNRNNSQLITNLNEAGAAQGDPFRAGQTTIGAIQGRDQALNTGVSSLYQQARDTSGRAADLDRAAFANRASELLDEAMVGGALPTDVQNKINWIATNQKPQGMHGNIEMPFNVDIAEQLKTQIAKLQRGTSDGSARHALGLVRQALDEAPLMPAGQVNPGNLPAVPGTVPPSPAVLGQQSIDAFNQARQAARQRFAWQESGRPIEAALNGAQPDKFVQQFVIGGTLDDARAIAQNAPAAEVKNAILAHLKEKALSGAADEIGKFSQSGFNRALNQIGERKLALFFSPEEIAALRANGRVASYMQVQPVGSAVNNSNSGALLIGKGYDAIKGLLDKVPGGQTFLTQPLNNIEIALKNRQAQNLLPGLLAQQERQPLGQGLLLPGLSLGGLLAAP